tara:strand:+ start:128 stop:262 length:135 start_codon:yes stop_codon:yes gene_type:complete
MNYINIALITLIFTLSFYIIFLLLGVGGIAKNRKAQGLDRGSSK